MSAYINIITVEETTEMLKWPVILAGYLAVAAMLGTFVWAIVTKRMDEARTGMLFGIVGAVGIAFLLLTCIICSIFFQVPTGRFEYTATIDKDKITVSQYEEFLEKYYPTFKDGVYYFSGGPLDE